MSLVGVQETRMVSPQIHSSDQGWVLCVEAMRTVFNIGIDNWTERWSLFSGGYENKEIFSLVCWVLDYIKVRGRKDEGETAR